MIASLNFPPPVSLFLVLVDSAVELILDDGDLFLLPFNANSFSWFVGAIGSDKLC